MKVNITLNEFELFVHRNGIAVMTVDQLGLIVDVTPALLEHTGYADTDLIGYPITNFTRIPQDVKSWYEDSYTNYIKYNKKYPFTEFILKNTKENWEYSMFPIENATNEQQYMILFHGKAVHTRQTLLKEFADEFLNDVNLGVVLLDTEFRLLNISDMACRILGLERDRVLNKPLDEIFSIPIDHQLVRRSILDGVIVRNHAVSWMNNQERFELLLDSNVFKDHHGATIGAYVIFKDVTNLRSLEEQVRRSDRLAMIGQISAGTAHEIRNPLTSIKGFLQIMQKTFAKKGLNKELEYIEVMLIEIDRINRLVSEFLLLSKPKHVTYEPVNLSSVIQEILPIIINEGLLHKVIVEYNGNDDLPPVLADREMIKQVCLNICKNGIEALPDGGKLTITEKVNYMDKHVDIEVHDTGQGIPPFLIDKIFDPFFTTKESGTGLGLPICQRIIHDMGGTIRAACKGFGTTFTISIPFSNK